MLSSVFNGLDRGPVFLEIKKARYMRAFLFSISRIADLMKYSAKMVEGLSRFKSMVMCREVTKGA